MPAPHQIAVCSWSLEPRDPQELIEMLRSLDLPAVQLALSPVVQKPHIWGQAVGRLREAGIAIVSGMMAMAGEDYSTLDKIRETGGVRPNATWPDNLAHARLIAQAAAEAGVNLVTFHAGFLPESPGDPERAVLFDRVATIADIFSVHGLSLGLETGQETAATLERVLHELNRPNVGINFDPANMILYGMGDPVDALRRLSPHVRQIHIKDAISSDTPGQWGREVPVGEGEVDWPGFFAVAQRINPRPALVIEREAGNSRLDDIAAARRVLEGHLAVRLG